MLFDLVEIQADQTTIRNLALQLGMIDGRAESLLPLFDEYLSARFGEENPAARFREVLLLNLSLVDQGEDQPINKDRLKDLGHVQVQGEPPEVSRMQEADAGIQMGAIYLAQGGDIHHRVTEANHGIEAVLRRPASPPGKGELLLPQDDIKGLVVALPDIALDGHESFRRGLLLQQRARTLNGIQYILQVGTAAQVITDHPLHILHCSLDELPGENEPPGRIQVMLRLIENQAAGIVMLPGIEGADVVAVVVEEVEQYLLLSEELQQAFVKVYLAEDVKLRGILHRDILLLALAVLEGQGILVALKFPAGEDVDWLFHGGSISIIPSRTRRRRNCDRMKSLPGQEVFQDL